MATLFNYDWFAGPAFAAQKKQALERVVLKKFQEVTRETLGEHTQAQRFLVELEARTIIYLRDGFSYEMKDMVDVGLRNNLLTFECEPVDDQYKVGSFIVTLPYDEIVRVEVFAVHPKEKPEDVPLITGFRSSPSEPLPRPEEPRD